jgi:hypothetical protein
MDAQEIKQLKELQDAYLSVYEAKKVDQDEDGDNDFADVRIARMIASGVSKEEAIRRVKDKEYNEEFEIDEAAKRTPKKVRGAKDPEAYMAGRSDGGKRGSGDAETGPRYYTLGRSRGATPDAPTQPGQRPVGTPKLADWEKKDIQYRKANLKAGKVHKVGGPKGLPEELDIYDLILSHLLDEGYADTQESAEVIMTNMSENWMLKVLDEAETGRGPRLIDAYDKPPYSDDVKDAPKYKPFRKGLKIKGVVKK